MNKRAVMLLFGLALVGGFFFLSRRASAETLRPSGGVQAGDASGALGSVPFSESVFTFPGGGSSPLAFEGGRGGVTVGSPNPKASPAHRLTPQPIARRTPRRLGLPGGIAGAPRSPKAPAPVVGGTVRPIAVVGVAGVRRKGAVLLQKF